MAKGYSQQIHERIEHAEEGTVFIHSDFTDIADAETIRRTLNRFVLKQLLSRILNGVYEKPRFSLLLQEYVMPNPNEVAKAIARNYHWSIAPSGNTSLNILGLSTQVTTVWSYRSDGPYKTYNIKKTTIEFKHRTNKEITGLSYITTLVLQALKELRKENVDELVISKLSTRLSDQEKSVLLQEASESTDWIYESIKKICKGGQK